MSLEIGLEWIVIDIRLDTCDEAMKRKLLSVMNVNVFESRKQSLLKHAKHEKFDCDRTISTSGYNLEALTLSSAGRSISKHHVVSWSHVLVISSLTVLQTIIDLSAQHLRTLLYTNLHPLSGGTTLTVSSRE